MEVLLFALFFISALIFFIAGKDDFGRTGSELKIKEEEKVTEKVQEEEKVTEEVQEDKKVTEEGNIEPKDDIKKEP